MKDEQLLEELRSRLRDAEKDAESFRGAIAAIERRNSPVAGMVVSLRPSTFVEDTPNFPKVRGMTQLQAIIALAKHNDGIVRAQDAKKLLLSSGLMKKTKNSTNIVHSTIIRSEKFERIGPGEYRLKDAGFFPTEAELEAVAHTASKPVQ